MSAKIYNFPNKGTEQKELSIYENAAIWIDSIMENYKFQKEETVALQIGMTALAKMNVLNQMADYKVSRRELVDVIKG